MAKKTFQKTCIQCGSAFVTVGPAARYCSQQCGQRYRYLNNMGTTEYQYSITSGNWRKYYQRRVSEKGRSAHVTLDELLALHETQRGLCALTGVQLTCLLRKNEPCFTNASLDRIEPGGPYTIDNLRLVCVGVNRFRANMPLNEYVEWCRKVVEHNKEVDHG